ncbi:MAG: hypothetical protein LBH30_07245 [Prevotellaceae bacterium]|nr:hypothetical protein [Prevotellaceae bacterium]
MRGMSATNDEAIQNYYYLVFSFFLDCFANARNDVISSEATMKITL